MDYQAEESPIMRNNVSTFRRLVRWAKSLVRIVRFLKYASATYGRSVLTEQEKRERLVFLGHSFNCKTFVETGTYLGDTARHMAAHFDKVYTIEKDENFYQASQATFAGHENITAILGDSAEKISSTLAELDERAVFYLDAHYCGWDTAITSNPIFEELTAIFSHGIKDHLIVIDDARLFNGSNGYPRIQDILDLIAAVGVPFGMRISLDFIILHHDPSPNLNSVT